MPKRMLIDASHPEETRVIVLDGNRVEEFDFESASKRPLKGNIYLAKVTRVEPSLQAAFVEYGGNRQGFLAFSEIHPDYYQIPVADRMALLAEQQEEARRGDDDFEAVETGTATASDEELEAEAESEETQAEAAADDDENAEEFESESGDAVHDRPAESEVESGFETDQIGFGDRHDDDAEQETAPEDAHVESIVELAAEESEEGIVDEQAAFDAAEVDADEHPAQPIEEPAPEDNHDEAHGSEEPKSDSRPAQPLRNQRPSQRWMRRRHYKIQEVIKRKQVMLVQVVKEERGTKGAALTTYLSLAGRYCVLMPNTPRGGGISRKITNAADRNRLKSAAAALELPDGMGLIIRTAGANRTKLEIKRDYEYLLRQWDQIRELTLQSNAPSCVYEEGDIIKRAIRDLYGKDINEVLVEGDEAYKNAKDFMRMLMPSHAKNVKQYRDTLPIFQKYNVEAQLDAMFSPTVTLKSGGYIVINQTEALVSIDVNSGRATREHSIEETAHKTNLEAADEVARQLRLRDLAGLIVIDFIDMEDGRNDRDVERRLRDAVKNDRARVQIGKISQFGLLEMSRQRLRAGVVASSTIPCPHCGGQGIVRSVESTALRVLRALDEEGQRQKAAAVLMKVANDVALYTLNQKRRELARIEADYGMTVAFEPKDQLMAGSFELDRIAPKAIDQAPPPQKPVVSAEMGLATPTDMSEAVEEDEHEDVDAAEEEHAESQPATEGAGQPQQGNGKKKRRRRRRGKGHGTGSQAPQTLRESIPSVNVADAGPVPEEYSPEAPGHDSHVPHQQDSEGGAHAHQHGQGQPGPASGSRRRRRRRRKPGGSHAPGQNGSHAGDMQGSESRGDSEPASSGDAFRQAPVVPNMPSEPLWSFTSDAAASPEVQTAHEDRYSNENVRAHATPAARPSEPDTGAAEQVVETAAMSGPASDESAKPTRKGWWQFRRS
ncbi:MAG TPA: Rne/Rng family ribonuclease [Rhizomicrobium sp.]|jgi:ribonuclease E